MHKNNLATPATLTSEDSTKLINEVQIGKEKYAPQRFIETLIDVYPRTLTTLQLNQDCAISNISDTASKINRRIFKYGYFIACQKPITPFKNRFGHTSQMCLWGLHRTQEAANDPVFDVTGE